MEYICYKFTIFFIKVIRKDLIGPFGVLGVAWYVSFIHVMEKPCFWKMTQWASTSKERRSGRKIIQRSNQTEAFVSDLLRVLRTVRQCLKHRQTNTMKKTFIILAGLLLLGVFLDQSHMRQAQSQPVAGELELDREIRRIMEKGTNLEERKRQVPAIAAAFSRYTVPERARWLTALCYVKTLGTSFMPMDLAEIALAETGGHGLSAKAVSEKGALGVWQLMPHRAKSHGYSPDEMENDEKCAEAAVRELATKLEMAKGNLTKAKKFYCGTGPDADAYEVRRQQFRREILEELNKVKAETGRNSAIQG